MAEGKKTKKLFYHSKNRKGEDVQKVNVCFSESNVRPKMVRAQAHSHSPFSGPEDSTLFLPHPSVKPEGRRAPRLQLVEKVMGGGRC